MRSSFLDQVDSAKSDNFLSTAFYRSFSCRRLRGETWSKSILIITLFLNIDSGDEVQRKVYSLPT